MVEVWRTAQPTWLMWIALREGVVSDRDHSTFMDFCRERYGVFMETALPHFGDGCRLSYRLSAAIHANEVNKRAYMSNRGPGCVFPDLGAAYEASARECEVVYAEMATWYRTYATPNFTHRHGSFSVV